MSHRQRFAQRQATAEATSQLYKLMGSNTVTGRQRANKEFFYSEKGAAHVGMMPTGPAALKCPGGPRMKGVGLRELFGVTSNGPLSKYDQRFILNLRLTHELMQYFDVCNNGDAKLFLELGPGVGALTRSLLTSSNVHGVVAVEADRRYAPTLDALANAPDLQCDGDLSLGVSDKGDTRTGTTTNNSRFSWVCGDLVKQDELTLLERAKPQFIRQRCHEMKALAYSTSPSNLRKVVEGNNFHGRRLRKNQKQEFNKNNKTDEFDDFFSMLDEEGKETDPHPDPSEAQSSRSTDTSHNTSSHTPSSTSLLPEGSDRDGKAQQPSLLDEEGVSPGVVDLCWSSLRPSVEVIGNLPFSITLPLCIRYAIDVSRKQNLFRLGRVPIHLFCQQAVAERLVAVPGTLQYGLPSVVIQNYFKVTVRRTFKETTFFPATEVLGALVTLEPRIRPLVGGNGSMNIIDGAPVTDRRTAQSHESSQSSDDFLDGATLLQFSKFIMAPRRRTWKIRRALGRVVPYEVAQFMLDECRINPEMPVLSLSVKEMGLLALYWHRYLDASNQMKPMEEYIDGEEVDSSDGDFKGDGDDEKL